MTGPHITLGVLGGMGPAATAEFLRLLAAHVPASTDQGHPRVLMLSEPSIPDRTGAILERGESPLVPIRNGLLTLASWGAGLLAVPCNTAHVYIDHMRGQLPVPLVHIVEATLSAAVTASPGGAWLTGTAGTMKSGIYQRYARSIGYRLAIPDVAMQRNIHAAATLVKENRVREAAGKFRATVGMLREREELSVITACTELPIAYAHSGLPGEHEVSSVDALASACVTALYEDSRPTGPLSLIAVQGGTQ